MQPQLTPEGELLVRNLNTAESTPLHTDGDKIHVSGVAGALYFAYEQLRNIAEYTEQHLILRATIERFLKRHMQFTDHPRKLGYELVEELTQERYLSNNSIAQGTVALIDDYIEYYIKLQLTLHSGMHHIAREESVRWTIQAASVTVEQLLNPSPKTEAFINFAYQHCLRAIDPADFPTIGHEDFDVAIYCAVHRALIKSDLATTRAYFIAADPARSRTVDEFIRVNRQLDKLFDSPQVIRLSRLISRNGAPLRIIREVTAQASDSAMLIQQPAKLSAHIGAVADEQYQKTHSRLVKSIVRTLVFVFITKALIGLLVEIPYDIWQHGMVLVTPLLVNMVFPPLYMATAMWAVKKPDEANTAALRKQVEHILYTSSDNPVRYRIPRRDISGGLRFAFRIVYTLAYAASFGLAIWLLMLLDFSWVHVGVFFLFFSAVSFFRFRLIQASRELDVNDRRESVFAIIGDFFYTPFIKLGEWLSARYRRINVVTAILDLLIEMPLKTTLRILQEWVRFMRDKREGF